MTCHIKAEVLVARSSLLLLVVVVVVGLLAMLWDEQSPQRGGVQQHAVASTYDIGRPSLSSLGKNYTEWNGMGRRVRELNDDEYWEFSVLVGFDKSTVEHYGGRNEIIELLLQSMDYVNSKFVGVGYEGQSIRFDVDVDSIFVLDDDDELTNDHISVDHEDHDYLLLINGRPNAYGGGWYGSDQTIHHVWSWDSDFGDTFGIAAMDGLVHEFGHSRGCIDIYALEVNNAAGNSVTGTLYEGPTSIMNYPYGENIPWDEHCIAQMKYYSSIAPTPSAGSFIHYMWPTYLIFDVGSQRQPAEYARSLKVTLYPIYWFSNQVSTAADDENILIFQPDDGGTVVINMDKNNFYQPVDIVGEQPWGLTIPNFLVTLTKIISDNYIDDADDDEVMLFDAYLPFTDLNLFMYHQQHHPDEQEVVTSYNVLLYDQEQFIDPTYPPSVDPTDNGSPLNTSTTSAPTIYNTVTTTTTSSPTTTSGIGTQLPTTDPSQMSTMSPTITSSLSSPPSSTPIIDESSTSSPSSSFDSIATAIPSSSTTTTTSEDDNFDKENLSETGGSEELNSVVASLVVKAATTAHCNFLSLLSFLHVILLILDD